jgi:hypothetical protein
VAGLNVDDIRYEGTTTDWLARPTWRDGKATAPATLVLEPRAGAMPPGTYTAHVPVVSSVSRDVSTLITATLVVRPPILVGPVGPVGPPPVGPPVDPCDKPRKTLELLERLTDPQSGTAAGARRVVGLVPALLPNLCLPVQRIEAQFRMADAYLMLSQTGPACELLRKIEPDAASTSFARTVNVYLSRFC